MRDPSDYLRMTKTNVSLRSECFRRSAPHPCPLPRVRGRGGVFLPAEEAFMSLLGGLLCCLGILSKDPLCEVVKTIPPMRRIVGICVHVPRVRNAFVF